MRAVANLPPIEIPADTTLEWWLAVMAFVERGKAEQLMAEMGPEHFYSPKAWEVITASVGLDGDLEADLQAVAERAGVEPAMLRHFVDSRPVYSDRSRSIQRQVIALAEKRWRVYELANELLGIAA